MSPSSDMKSPAFKRIGDMLTTGRCPGRAEFMLHSPRIQAQFKALWTDDAVSVAVGDDGFAVVYRNGRIACSTAAKLDAEPADPASSPAGKAQPGIPVDLAMYLRSLHSATLTVAAHVGAKGGGEAPATPTATSASGGSPGSSPKRAQSSMSRPTLLPPSAQVALLALGTEDRFFVMTRDGKCKWHASPGFDRAMRSLNVGRDVAAVAFGMSWESWLVLLNNGTARFSRIPDSLRDRLTGVDGPLTGTVSQVALAPGFGYWMSYSNGAWESRNLPHATSAAVDTAVTHFKGQLRSLVCGGWGTWVLTYGAADSFAGYR